MAKMVMEEQRGQELPKMVKHLPPDLKNVVAENSSRTRKVLDSCFHFDIIQSQHILNDYSHLGKWTLRNQFFDTRHFYDEYPTHLNKCPFPFTSIKDGKCWGQNKDTVITQT